MTGTSPLPPPPTRGSEGTRGLPAAGGPWPHCGSRSAGSCGPPPRAPPAAGSIHAFSCLRHLPRRARGEDGSARGRPLPGSLSVTPPPPPPRCEEGERGKKEGWRRCPQPHCPCPGRLLRSLRRARPHGGERRRPEGWVRVHAAGYRGGVRGGGGGAALRRGARQLATAVNGRNGSGGSRGGGLRAPPSCAPRTWRRRRRWRRREGAAR